MARIEVGEAVSAGFKLIGRQPLAVVMWGLAYLLVSGLPALLLYWTVGPEMVGFYRDAFRHPGVAPDMASMMAMQAKLGLVQPVTLLTSIVSRAVLMAAVFRAMLTPEDRGFFYLRLSMAEVWQGLVFLVIAVLLGVAFFVIFVVAILVGVVLALIGGAAHSAAGAVIVAIGVTALVLASVAALLYLALRFSMAGPMTFAHKQFRLFESWALTKGHMGGLFLVGLSLFAIGLLIAIVFDGVILAVVLSIVGAASQGLGPSIRSFFEQPPDAMLQAAGPWIAVMMVLGSLFVGAMTAIFLAPWAVIYRRLTASPEQAFT